MASSDDVMRRRRIFLKIHSGIPREGPGDSASTHRAYQCVNELPVAGQILDVGCGPGTQTIDLASVTASRIVALDNHRPYLNELGTRVRLAGLSARVRAVQASMFTMPFRKASFDLIWAEGAIYLLGFERALNEWRSLLRPAGHLAATHLSWLATDVPSQPRDFWQRHYPAIRHVDDNLALCAQHGFDIVDHFTLPESAWWTHYYAPMEARLTALRNECAADHDALALIDASGEQIELYRRFARYYGYVFYILRMRRA